MAIELEKINFEDLPSTKTPIDSTNLNKMQDNIENTINIVPEMMEDGYEYGEWIPYLSNWEEDTTPTVSYSRQLGFYTKVPIKGTTKSLIHFSFSIKGVISAITGNNYAAIAGLPFTPILSGYETCFFSCFLKGVNDSHPLPAGRITRQKIGVYNTSTSYRGGAIETWVTNTTACDVQGSGFYITEE